MMKLWRVLKWVLAFLCLLLFGFLAMFYSRCTAIDQGVYQALSHLISEPMTWVMKGFTTLASPLVLVLLGGLLFFFSKHKEYRFALLINLLVAVLLNLGLKSDFLRIRPDVIAFVTETGYSFPSGHAMAAMGFYGFLIYLEYQTLKTPARKRWTAAGLSLIILMVGISRVYLGVHFFTDVIAGYCVAFAYLVVYTAMIGRFVAQGRNESTIEAPSRKNATLIESFGHAFDGICSGLRNERNMVIHFVATIFVVVFGLILKISLLEWALCALCIGVVMGSELINTAVEASVDLSTDKPDPRAKLAKDAAAGAVLVAAFMAAVVGLIIFLPKLYTVIMAGLA